ILLGGILLPLGVGIFYRFSPYAHEHAAHRVAIAFATTDLTSVAAWFGLYFALHLFEAREREESLSNARTLALKDVQVRALFSQLIPHFIFNCINGIRYLAEVDSHTAKEMLEGFWAFLRYAWESADLTVVALGDELAAIEQYVAVEKIRFEDRLQ